jgi:hypothetical protein
LVKVDVANPDLCSVIWAAGKREMKGVFSGNIEVAVHRNGREIDRVTRPLRQTQYGPVVVYKKKFWPVKGNTIDISGRPLTEEQDTAPRVVTATAGPQPKPAAAPEPAPDRPIVKDDGQDRIVTASPEARLIVDAGPGTGKTHTACLRVAGLIDDHGVAPSRIWIISFTRTAVHEIRSRLADFLDDPARAASVRIATLDSVAWTLHSGFTKDAVLTGSYDDNIRQTLQKIESNPDIQEEFEKLRHIVVDEAQDIVGDRADLVLAMIDTVDSDCGVTVFADRAQAIYGFTEDESASEEDAGTTLLEELEDREFEAVSLTQVHRTDAPGLLKIFTDLRARVLDDDTPASARGTEVRSEIRKLADADAGPSKSLKLESMPGNGLVLMRQRWDVLQASSYNQDTPHRLRLSGLPARVLPWPGLLLRNHAASKLTRFDFEKLWEGQVRPVLPDTSKDAAWALLVETAGETDTVISITRLRTVLGRANPPATFTSPEYGDSGPIIGTIHASKGREAEEVCLYLPPEADEDDEYTDADEELRVIYVGATRARRKLSVGDSPGRQSSNVEGRVWRRRGDSLQVEIGRAYDIDARGLVGRSSFTTAAEAKAAQEFIIAHPVMSGLKARAEKSLGWKLELQTQDDRRIGVLSDKVHSDLKEIAKRCDTWKPPGFLPYIRSFGLRTIVLRPDDPQREQLHEPWRSSGFIIAPMLIGICPTKLKK